MTDIQIIAASLLTLRIISVAFVAQVIKRQTSLMRLKDAHQIGTLRKVLFSLALVIFFGQWVPITIDVATLLADVPRSAPSTLGVAYAFSNAFTAVLSSILLWLVYRVSEQQSVGLAKKQDTPQRRESDTNRVV